MSDIPEGVKMAVDTRDEQRCFRCREWIAAGGSRHHRKLRSRQGANTVQNLVLLCGSGTTRCHGWVHANVAEATRVGLIVPSWREPENVPILRGELFLGGAYAEWFLLEPTAQLRPLTAPEAANLMEVM